MGASLVVSALTGIAGSLGERAALVLELPRRVVWLFSSSIASGVSAAVFGLCLAFSGWRGPQLQAFSCPAIDAAILLLWPILIAIVITFHVVSWVRLTSDARAWCSAMLDGVHVWIAEEVGPGVFGFLRPRIVVPRRLLQANDRERAAVLAHELQHVAAKDQRLRLFEIVVQSLMPWNLPLCWQLRQLRFAIEVDCDLRVVNGRMIDRLVYANAILDARQRYCNSRERTSMARSRAAGVDRRVEILRMDRGA